MKANIPQMPRIAAFSDDMRDALRGPFSDDTVEGWLGRSAVSDCEADMNLLKESLKAGIAGMIAHPQVDYSKVNYSSAPYALEPTQMMAYVSCHDDMCLVDRLMASVIDKGNHTSQFSTLSSQLREELIRLDLLAQTAVFTSQGIPFMLSGEEMLRDKKGVHNSYNSPDSINRLDWNNLQRYPQVFDYYKNLIAMRKHHPMFRLGTADLVRKHLEFLPTADCLVAYRLTAPQQGRGKDSWGSAIIILNANAESRVVEIPQGEYTIVCKDGKIDEQGLGTVQGGKVTVAPQSALILHD
jgi:pullulanase